MLNKIIVATLAVSAASAIKLRSVDEKQAVAEIVETKAKVSVEEQQDDEEFIKEMEKLIGEGNLHLTLDDYEEDDEHPLPKIISKKKAHIEFEDDDEELIKKILLPTVDDFEEDDKHPMPEIISKKKAQIVDEGDLLTLEDIEEDAEHPKPKIISKKKAQIVKDDEKLIKELLLDDIEEDADHPKPKIISKKKAQIVKDDEELIKEILSKQDMSEEDQKFMEEMTKLAKEDAKIIQKKKTTHKSQIANEEELSADDKEFIKMLEQLAKEDGENAKHVTKATKKAPKVVSKIDKEMFKGNDDEDWVANMVDMATM